MKKPASNSWVFGRRAFVFAGVQLATLGVLGARLCYLQLLRASEYKTLAEDNRIKLQLIPPPRGRLLDRFGAPLAINQKNYRVLIDLEQAVPVDKTLQALHQVIPIDEDIMKRLIRDAKKLRYAPPALVKEHLTWDDLAVVEFHSPDLPGVIIDTNQARFYPLAEKSAHLVGYVGAVAEGEVDEEPLTRLPDFKIGKNGIEKLYERELRGTAGVRSVEVNARGLSVRELSTRAPMPGNDIRLTIDARLQDFAGEKLAEHRSGGAVVMNIHNGDVLALVSMPGFDPNRFSLGITNDYWKDLNADVANPLLNKSISGQYPPGSTFKLAVGLAALEAGVVTPEQSVHCGGHFYLGSHDFTCWKPEGHGTVNIITAIAQSCDVFFYTMAQRLGIEKIADMARRLGLGQNYETGLASEKSGIVPDAKWKQKRYKQPWQGGDTINSGIGQGYVLATPLQLAVMTARIANGGIAVVPRFLHPDIEPADVVSGDILGLTPQHVQTIQQGMIAVTSSAGGTAYSKRILDPRYTMAGKTGTSQVRKLIAHGINQDSLPWEDRHHALFVGYAPIEKPRYAAAVLVEHGGGGASAAAPVARDILEKIQQLDEAPTPNADPNV